MPHRNLSKGFRTSLKPLLTEKAFRILKENETARGIFRNAPVRQKGLEGQMSDFLITWYFWIKAFHLIFVITWMAGLFYLPRLFVYHTRVKAGGEEDQRFQMMEKKLLKIIMNPSIVLVWIFGLMLVFTPGVISWADIWPWVKAGAVIALTGFHHSLGRWRKDFATGKNQKPESFYRKVNEVPSILLVIIVIMVVVKPF